MKKIIKTTLACAAVMLIFTACGDGTDGGNDNETLKEVLDGRFYIGTALNVDQIHGRDAAGIELTKRQFNSIVAENCMKGMYIQPEEGEFFFEDADKFVEFGQQNDMWIIGHTLVWHSQPPHWIFTDESGNDVSREVLIERMRNHIQTVVGRYKGRVHGWDVVNEAVMDDGTLRDSKYLQIIGEDYLELAFRFAHEADPDAELYYNDYSMALPEKRDGVVRLVNSLKEAGVRIDGIGMQGHLSMDFPTVEEFEKSLLAFSATGCKVMITELDLSILPNRNRNVGAEVSSNFDYEAELNPYAEGLPEEMDAAWNRRMGDFFDLFLKHSDKITRVTLWGVADGDSWRNDWPIPGRTDYALLFDRNHQPKPVVNHIIEQSKN